ncbi:MAG TPA: hypothetical protein VKU77_33725 [Streptosporangiaceae bacterium]|nr:hypothetical protein [Streptosporangiaceae bacterium]
MTFAHPAEQYTASLRRFLNGFPQSGRAQYRSGGTGCPHSEHRSVMCFTF